MKKILTIRANDDTDGDVITIGMVEIINEHGTGWRLEADNGDDIGYYRPQSADKCIDDAWAMYESWSTVESIDR